MAANRFELSVQSPHGSKQRRYMMGINRTPSERSAQAAVLTTVFSESKSQGRKPAEILAGAIPRGTESLLVVEDDASLRKLTCKILEYHTPSTLAARVPEMLDKPA